MPNDAVDQDIVTRLIETERKLEESNEFLKSVFSGINAAIFVLDAEGTDFKIAAINSFQEWLSNASATRLIGKPASELRRGLPESQVRAAEERYAQCVSSRKTVEYEERMSLAGNKECFLTQLNPVIADNGRVTRIIGSSIVISELKKSEKELKRVLKKAEESNRSLEHFAHIASHELQEPVRLVSSFLQIFAKDYGKSLDKRGLDFIERSLSACDRMRSMIDDLLNYSRLSARAKEACSCDADKILDMAVENLDLQIRESKARIRKTCLPSVLADPDLLLLVFNNLLSNAIKYSNEGESPRIFVSWKKAEGNAVISICDTGIGIETHNAERAFQLFARLAPKAKAPGHGIGLASCKKIMERLGGRIWIEPRAGQGATLRFSLPLA